MRSSGAAAVVAAALLAVAAAAMATATPCAQFPATTAAAAACTLTLGEHAKVNDDAMVAIGAGETHYFEIPAAEAGKSMQVMFRAFSGAARVYGTFGGVAPSSSQYDLVSKTGAGFTIPADACGEAPTCRLSLAVEATEGARYTLVVSAANTVTTLTPFIPTNVASLQASQYAMFQITMPAEAHGNAIMFAVTPDAGDPDVYVDVNPQVSTHSYKWRSTQVGNDVVEIMSTDSNRPQEPATYYIAVYACCNRNASFWIAGWYENAAPVQLTNGAPIYGVVDLHYTLHFSLVMPASASKVTISTTPLWGDPDLKVNINHVPTTGGTYDYYSSSSQGDDTVIAASTDAAWKNHCPKGQACTVYIDVYGFVAAGFYLTATTDGMTVQLLNGVPFLDAVNRTEYNYYQLTVLDNVAPIVITLSPHVGDPDLFVSVSPNEHPTNVPGHYTWSATSTNVDQVIISTFDAHRCAPPCNYYIGVSGYSVGVTAYTITANAEDANAPLEIVPGMPAHSSVAPGRIQYFQYINNGWWTDLQFSLSTFNGEAEMYVNNVVDPGTGQVALPYVVCSIAGCRVTNSIWSSTSSPQANEVFIPVSDPRYTYKSVYIIAVYSLPTNTEPTLFTLFADNADQVWTLWDSYPFSGYVAAGSYDYYRVIVPNFNSDITILLTTLSGDGDLYASDHIVNPTNAPGNYDWLSLSSGTYDRLVLQPSELKGCQTLTANSGQSWCEIFVGVYGFKNTSYTIVTTQSQESPITLLEGQPQAGFVNQSSYSYFTFENRGTDLDVTISVTPVFGDPDLYVTVDGSIPGRHHYQYQSAYSSGADTLTIPGAQCDKCTVNVAVYGFKSSQFVVSYDTSTSIVVLQAGQPRQGHCDSGGYQYFQFSVFDQQADITISLTALSGDPDMYVITAVPGQPLDLPNRENFIWSGVTLGSDVVFIPHTDTHFCSGCTYLMAVYGFFNSTYTVTFTSEETTIISLVAGVPQMSYVVDNTYRYFNFRDSTDKENVTFQVTPVTGAVSMYVTNTYIPATANSKDVGQLPTSNNYIWSSSRTSSFMQRGTILITPQDPYWHDTVLGTPYTIGVKGVVESVFRLTASTSDAIERLQVDVPSADHYVNRGSMSWFVFDLDNANTDVSLLLTVLSGAPTIVVSTTYEKPYCEFYTAHHVNCYNYTWMNTPGDDVLLISASAPCSRTMPAANCNPAQFHPGPFYIGVFGFVASHFTVTAHLSGGSTALIDGQPQIAATSSAVYCPDRSMDTGKCIGDPSTWTTIQAAFFSFTATPDSNGDIPELSFTVNRPCNWETGCPDTLWLYITACSTDCVPEDMYPSGNNNDYSLHITSHWNSLVIPQDVSADCIGSNVACNFYVTVQTDCTGADCISDTIQVFYTSEYGVQMISHDCYNGHMCPVPAFTLAAGQNKQYEVYLGPTTAPFSVQLQACTGQVSLYACHDPTKCTTDVFNPAPPNNYEYALSTGSNGVANFTLAGASGAWFFSVYSGGSGAAASSYQLLVGNGASAVDVVPPSAPVVVASAAGAGNVLVTWAAPNLNTLGSGNSVSSGASYTVYAIPSDSVGNYVTNTVCGLQGAVSSITAAVTSSSVTTLSTTLQLAPGTSYVFNVVATCGSGCVPSDQTSQTVAYAPITYQVPAAPKGGLSPGGIVGIVLAVIIVPVAAFFGYRYWKSRQVQHEDNVSAAQYNLL